MRVHTRCRAGPPDADTARPSRTLAGRQTRTQDLEYAGTTPTSKNMASRIIDDVLWERRAGYLRRKALRYGADHRQIERILELAREKKNAGN